MKTDTWTINLSRLRSMEMPAQPTAPTVPTPPTQPSPSNGNQPRVFTIEQLATYNGKNGAPAYIAVNDIVYDMSNIAAWAAATHFGLRAGNDLTKEFNSCHPGAGEILSSLPTVGILVEESI